MGVPVVAYAAAAVPATLDGGGVLIHDKDPVAVAALVHEIATNRGLQDRIVCSQDRALDRLLARDFAGTLLEFIDQVWTQPPRGIRRRRLTSGTRSRRPRSSRRFESIGRRRFKRSRRKGKATGSRGRQSVGTCGA